MTLLDDLANWSLSVGLASLTVVGLRDDWHSIVVGALAVGAIRFTLRSHSREEPQTR